MDEVQLEATLRSIKLEVADLKREKARLDQQRASVDARIAKRESYLQLTEDLLMERKPRVLVAPSSQREPMLIEHAVMKVVTDPDLALLNYPRYGYGAVTRAVERLLETTTDGYTAREIAAILQRLRFVVKDSHESTVRSALKNLRNKKRVLHNDQTGRYQLIISDKAQVSG